MRAHPISPRVNSQRNDAATIIGTSPDSRPRMPAPIVLSRLRCRAHEILPLAHSPTIRVDSHAHALAFYQRLREANRAVRCDFFEGVVMKRADSVYPVQMRSAKEECRGWCKHRFVG